MSELLLGCGNSRVRRFTSEGIPLPPEQWVERWSDLTTADIDAGCNPDWVIDLNEQRWNFQPDSFDEIHAYEVLEHLGFQGHAASFFGTFSECYRLLKPGGILCATTPSFRSMWAWGDPGHRRIINAASITFLDRTAYRQVGHTPMTDYREIWSGDFEILHVGHQGPDTFVFSLQAHKPWRTST